MKVLVCGGRTFENGMLLFGVMDALHSEMHFTMLLHGAARGADRLAEAWALRARVPFRRFHADWKRKGNAAGPIRNQKMLETGKPQLVIAFPGGRGTRDMITRALAADVKVLRVKADGTTVPWHKVVDVEDALDLEGANPMGDAR